MRLARRRCRSFALGFGVLALAAYGGNVRAGEESKVLFHDSFQGKLVPGWRWVREDAKNWRVGERGLEVRIQPGNMWGPANDARNVLLRPVPDPQQQPLEITAAVWNHPTHQYEQVDLVWYYTDSHMVKIGEELVDGKLSVVMGREENDRTRTISITPLNSENVELRLLMRDGRIRGYFKTPRTGWRDVGECDLPVKGPPHISLQFYQGPKDEAHWARVSDLTVRRAATADGPHDGTGAAGSPALPGIGLAQHDFLYCGEWDTRKPMQTLFLVKGGKVVWTYQIPIKDPNGNLSEFSDVHMVSNGDIVFAYKTGWRKINQAKQTLYHYQCPRLEHGWAECHSAQPIGRDKVLFMQNGTPAKLILYDIAAGKVEMEHEMRTSHPADPKSIHGQFRNVRMTRSGTWLISHMDLGKVIEYDKNWDEIWLCDAPSVWDAVRLKNGNTLISGNQHAFVREIDPAGRIVWEVKDGDLPGIKINGVHQVCRLANGNTVFCNWTFGVKKPDWPTIVQAIEVTPAKNVVWALRQWADPDLGPASCIQLLDEPGNDEEGDLQR